MPEQKGKKKRKPRSRGSGAGPQESTPAAATSQAARPVRRGWQGPPWMNAALGVFMLIAGVYFFGFAQQGMDIRTRLLLLVAYIAVAGFYFFRAYKGYRARTAGGG
jgi:predicted lipid-binding transport protein (Tim44 family)